MIKVEIGGGIHKRPGFVSCDIRKLPTTDYVCNADRLPFEDESVDELYSRHFIEHLTLREFLKTLAEWNRVLKKEGELYIVCPNLLWHLKQILDGSHKSFYEKDRGHNDRYWGYGSLFGWQQDKYDIHKFGYYYELLSDIIAEFGFNRIVNLTNMPNSLENSPYHLELCAKKQKNFLNYKNTIFYKHFNIKH